MSCSCCGAVCGTQKAERVLGLNIAETFKKLPKTLRRGATDKIVEILELAHIKRNDRMNLRP